MGVMQPPMKRTCALGSLLSATAVVMLGNLVEPGRVMGQGVAQGPPPPASAKTIKYKGRVIPQLEDITETAGIHFTHSSAPHVDNDGWLDVFTVNGHVYPQGNGTFWDASDQARVSRGFGVGDLFNDGNMDLVIEDLVANQWFSRIMAFMAITGSALNLQVPKATDSPLAQD